MIFGSVCSGIEAASVAWHPLGWKAAWLAEIEPFPSSVLAYHYPSVPNLGDMTALASRVRAGEIIAPDVLVGGTPCQAFSVAGLRQGLNDPRGQLTLRFVELCNAIDDVRRAGRKHPAVIVWENVPGVLSDKTNGFGCLLAGLVGDDEEIKPPHGKWKKSGVVMGPERLAVWRVLDAQFFGVAQRRRRVFVISVSLRHAGAWAIAESILPVGKGVRRDTAPSRQPRKGVTHDIAPCLTSSGRGVERGGDTRGQDPVVAVGFQSSQSGVRLTEAHATLDANNGSRRHNGVICMAHGQGGAEVASERSPTLTCNHEAPIIVHGTQDPCVSRDTAFALGRNNGGENVIAIQDCTGRVKMQNGKGWNADGAAYTVDTNATQGVAFAFAQNTRNELRIFGGDGQIVGALAAQPGMKQTSYVAFESKQNGANCTEEFTPTLTTGGGGGLGAGMAVASTMAVRRLTPRECERLQGFPDDYTLVEWYECCGTRFPERMGKNGCENCNGDKTARLKTAADGPRYKALGNSMAVPVMAWIGKRISEALKGYGEVAA